MSRKPSSLIDVIQRTRHVSVDESHEATLRAIKQFLEDSGTSSTDACSHVIIDRYKDWWVTQNFVGLQITDESAMERLHSYINILSGLGIPLTLAEKQTQEFQCFFDLEIRGTRTEAMGIEELFGSEAVFPKILRQAMGSVFPARKWLDVAVFHSTGLANSMAVMLTQVRVVCLTIIVNKERALLLKEHMVDSLSGAQDDSIKTLTARMESFSKENSWNNLFRDRYSRPRDSDVRMLFCDSLSPLPLQKPEGRPFVPFCIERFNYEEGKSPHERIVEEKDGLEAMDWLKLSVIRKELGTELTNWSPAACRSPPRAPGGMKVKLRTHGGSEPRQPRQRGHHSAPQTAVPSFIVAERRYEGNPADFRQNIKRCFGEHDDNFHENADTVVWQSRSSAACIEFNPSTHLVFVKGSPAQVRSLLNLIESFVHAVGSRASLPSTRSTPAARPQHSPPSEVFRPRGASVPVQTSPGAAPRPPAPSRRIARVQFQAETDSELALSPGDCIDVLQDPEGHGNEQRWVYGMNMQSQLRGWFPLSFTQVSEEPVWVA